VESPVSIRKNHEKSTFAKCRFGIRAIKYFSSDSAESTHREMELMAMGGHCQRKNMNTYIGFFSAWSDLKNRE
jgi:hypothetical protein